MIDLSLAEIVIKDKDTISIPKIVKKYFVSPEILSENFTITYFYYSKSYLIIIFKITNEKHYIFKRSKEWRHPYNLTSEHSKIAKKIINEKKKINELFQEYNEMAHLTEYIYIEKELEIIISDFQNGHYFMNILNGRSTLAIEILIFNNFYNYMVHQNLLIKLSATFIKNKDIERDITALISVKENYEDALKTCNKKLKRKEKEKEIYDSNILLLKSNEEIDAQFDEYNLKKQLRGL